jgi:hypothetical protein
MVKIINRSEHNTIIEVRTTADKVCISIDDGYDISNIDLNSTECRDLINAISSNMSLIIPKELEQDFYKREEAEEGWTGEYKGGLSE